MTDREPTIFLWPPYLLMFPAVFLVIVLFSALYPFPPEPDMTKLQKEVISLREDLNRLTIIIAESHEG